MIFIYELVRFLMANFEVNGGLVQTYPLKNVFCVLWIFHNISLFKHKHNNLLFWVLMISLDWLVMLLSSPEK